MSNQKIKVKNLIEGYINSLLEEPTLGGTDKEIRLKFVNYLVMTYTNTNDVIEADVVYNHFIKKHLK